MPDPEYLNFVGKLSETAVFRGEERSILPLSSPLHTVQCDLAAGLQAERTDGGREWGDDAR